VDVYRLYLYGSDNHVLRAINVECGSDEEALKQATDFKHEHKVEVWLEARKVGEVAGSR